MNPDPTVMVRGKAEAVSPRAAQKFAASQNLAVDTGTPLSLQDLAGSSPNALPSPPPASGKSNPVRRLSDPRLTQKLLETMDSGAGGGRTPQAKVGGGETLTSPVTPSTGGKRATKRASQMKERMKAASATTPNDDRKLFSSVKSMERQAKAKPYNPKLVASIRGEDYATLYQKNSDAHKKTAAARGQVRRGEEQILERMLRR